MGVNAGSNIYKIGFLCLIGIAHLPESQQKLKYHKTFELRPCITTNLAPMIAEELGYVPDKAKPILGNLFHSIKLICSKVLPVMSVSGNIRIPENNVFLRHHEDLQSFNDQISHKIASVAAPNVDNDLASED